ncbi:MAG: hypothetical protein ACJAVE_001915 [Polaribacter sp.]|jgi:hypothetical protein
MGNQKKHKTLIKVFKRNQYRAFMLWLFVS